jgi:two-component system KDP operon response regulator KdpE
MSETILLIDDDAEFRTLTQTWLHSAGYEAITAEDGAMGLRRVYSSRPDLVLLDVNMPQLDGWEVCRQIRGMSDIPVIMVTVNGQTTDLLRGFGLGADDYITKPLDFSELMARIDAILRRCSIANPKDKPEVFRYEELEVDWNSHQVYINGKRIRLSPTEFRLLACLIENRGWVVPHERLLRKVWGPNYIGDKSFVKLYIRYLRQKIEADPGSPKFILTERGIGYRFATQNNLGYN